MPTVTNSRIWVSDLNARPGVRSAFPKSTIRFYDTTLRDGEQTVGVVLSPQQKLEIARHLDALGISRIEAGFPRVSVDDAEAITLMLKAGLKAELWGFSRAVPADVEELVRLGLRASVIESPTSEIKLRAYGIAPDDLLSRVKSAVGFASKQGIRVAFFAVDSTRSDLGYLRDIYGSALQAGADEISVVDTIGACAPETAEYLVSQVRSWFGKSVPIHWHGHNDFGLATASAIAAVRGGADWIQGTINGMGERAGNADLCEVALALQFLYHVPVELDLSKAREVSDLVQKYGGYTVDSWKPVVGKFIFTRESGGVAAQFHMPSAIEPYSAEILQADRHVALGKKSGLANIKIKLDELGLSAPADKHGAILEKVKSLGTAEKRLVTDDEFRAMVKAVA